MSHGISESDPNGPYDRMWFKDKEASNLDDHEDFDDAGFYSTRFSSNSSYSKASPSPATSYSGCPPWNALYNIEYNAIQCAEIPSGAYHIERSHVFLKGALNVVAKNVGSVLYDMRVVASFDSAKCQWSGSFYGVPLRTETQGQDSRSFLKLCVSLYRIPQFYREENYGVPVEAEYLLEVQKLSGDSCCFCSMFQRFCRELRQRMGIQNYLSKERPVRKFGFAPPPLCMPSLGNELPAEDLDNRFCESHPLLCMVLSEFVDVNQQGLAALVKMAKCRELCVALCRPVLLEKLLSLTKINFMTDVQCMAFTLLANMAEFDECHEHLLKSEAVRDCVKVALGDQGEHLSARRECMRFLFFVIATNVTKVKEAVLLFPDYLEALSVAKQMAKTDVVLLDYMNVIEPKLDAF